MARRRHRKRRSIRVTPLRRAPPGSAPGTLATDPCAPKPLIRVFSYDRDTLEERNLASARDIAPLKRPERVLWVDVDAVGDVKTLHTIGATFALHPLSLEDVVNVPQRPKVESFEEHLFCVLRMASLGEHVEMEQVSLFLGESFVVTFQERPGDCLEAVRERLRSGRSHIRGEGADYLFYSLVDAIIDSYFPLFEDYMERLEILEEKIIERPSLDSIERIQHVRHDLMLLRRAVWPMREVMDHLLREEHTELIAEGTRPYLRDCYDHSIQLLDVLETSREIGEALLDTYNSSVNLRTNDVIRVLTIMTSLFIPLSFIAGVYGMNFDPGSSPLNMPELTWRWGYPFALGLMGVTGLGLLWFFRRKGWLGTSVPSIGLPRFSGPPTTRDEEPRE